jgi:DNA-binding beta-propeller fold protein YncE
LLEGPQTAYLSPTMSSRRALLLCFCLVGTRCVKTMRPGDGGLSLPLVAVSDVALPGNASRFDYQDVDVEHGHLALAHMGDSELLVLSLSDGATVGRVPGIDTVRGVVVAASANRILATAMNGQLVSVDATTLAEVGRTSTGLAPDGVAWDPVHAVVATSDQRAGALSLLADAGNGARTAVPLGAETGNVVFDASRQVFWVTVPPRLVSVNPQSGAVLQKLELPGCEGAHGLRLHPDGKTAFVACEDNDVLVRIGLEGGEVVTAPLGHGPDVLAVDPGLSWLYVAAEGGEVVVFDISREGLHELGRERPGPNPHTVAVDPATHRVYFPLEQGPSGAPVLRIMRPAAR